MEKLQIILIYNLKLPYFGILHCENEQLHRFWNMLPLFSSLTWFFVSQNRRHCWILPLSCFGCVLWSVLRAQRGDLRCGCAANEPIPRTTHQNKQRSRQSFECIYVPSSEGHRDLQNGAKSAKRGSPNAIVPCLWKAKRSDEKAREDDLNSNDRGAVCFLFLSLFYPCFNPYLSSFRRSFNPCSIPYSAS